jgi:hypothetical protein
MAALTQQFEGTVSDLRSVEVTQDQGLKITRRAIDWPVLPEKPTPRMVADQSALDADLWHRSERYFRELGPNAYAVLNVLTDFASHPPENSRMRRDRPTLQRMAGRWLREFRDASKVPGFAMAEHIKGLSPLATEQRTASKMPKDGPSAQ